MVEQADSRCSALIADSAGAPLRRTKITRRAVGPQDVEIKTTYAGICHSDAHQLRNDWGRSRYPMVPGHEIVGVVTAVGTDVTRFSVGDRVGVGCMTDSCRSCRSCDNDQEQYCRSVEWTYNSERGDGGEITFGGYSSGIVVREHFVARVPDAIPDEAAAPLLCAGATVYSPLDRFGIIDAGDGKRVGVAGLGGLGHMAVKIAKAAGADVVVLSRSDAKRDRAAALGAALVNYNDAQAVATEVGRLDVIIDTIAVQHDVDAFLPLLKAEASVVVLGIPTGPGMRVGSDLVLRGVGIAGSLIAGMRQTREMLAFCAGEGKNKAGVPCYPDVTVISAGEAQAAIGQLLEGRVPGAGGRYVINVKDTLQ